MGGGGGEVGGVGGAAMSHASSWSLGSFARARRGQESARRQQDLQPTKFHYQSYSERSTRTHVHCIHTGHPVERPTDYPSCPPSQSKPSSPPSTPPPRRSSPTCSTRASVPLPRQCQTTPTRPDCSLHPRQSDGRWKLPPKSRRGLAGPRAC